MNVTDRLGAAADWRYLPGGAVVHALIDGEAECGRVLPESEWRGTGSQVGYETAERLPACRLCVAKVGGRP